MKRMLGMHGALLDYWILLVLELLVTQCYISKANTFFSKMSNINEIMSLGNKFGFVLRFNFLAFPLKSCP